MKKRLFILPLIALSLTSCGKYLDKPNDTTLEFWITERVTSEMAKEKGCTFIPGMFGGDMYLGSHYQMVEIDDVKQVPEIRVIYTITGYPDTLNDRAVTHINISDPAVTVYGLTMNSSKEEIAKRMKELKFKDKTDEWGNSLYNKNNCTFRFSELGIDISAEVSNIWHVVY